MDAIRLNMGGSSNITLLSNDFIDNYMKDANEMQIKLYLYLLRTQSAGRAVSISGLADFFNYPEKDIERALRYWESKGVIAFDTPSAPNPEVTKQSYTIEMLRAFKKSPETSWLITAMQQYTGRPVAPSQISSLLYMYSKLNMSPSLIDYLMQYCIECGEDSIRYMEETAMYWAERGITTPEKAKLFLNGSAEKQPEEADTMMAVSDDQVEHIMFLLGRSGKPAPMELLLINRWLCTYGFSMEMIEEACNRAVTAVENNRPAYAEGILKQWHEKNIRTLDEVRIADEAFRSARFARNAKPANNSIFAPASKDNRDSTFCNIEQHDYDFDELARRLVGSNN